MPAVNIGMEEHRIEAAADATDAIDAPLLRSAPRQQGTREDANMPCHLDRVYFSNVGSIILIFDKL